MLGSRNRCIRNRASPTRVMFVIVEGDENLESLSVCKPETGVATIGAATIRRDSQWTKPKEKIRAYGGCVGRERRWQVWRRDERGGEKTAARSQRRAARGLLRAGERVRQLRHRPPLH